MSFYDVLSDIMQGMRIGSTDLEVMTGVRTSNIDWWKKNPDARPQRAVLQRIEEGLGIVFDFGEGIRNVVGWRRKGEKQEGDGNLSYDDVSGLETPGGIGEMYSLRLRNLVNAVREKYLPSSFGKGEAMNEQTAALYEALFRTLTRDLENISEEAETAVRRRIREFENELDKRKIQSHTIQQEVN